MSPLGEGFIITTGKRNMNKKIMLAVMTGIFLMVVLSAAFMPRFGKITSTTNVIPPEIGVEVPVTEEDCENDNWKTLLTLGSRSFNNEEDCKDYVKTNMCRDFKLLEGYPGEFDSYEKCEDYFNPEELNETNGDGETQDEI